MAPISAPASAEIHTETWEALGTTALLRHTGPPQPALRAAVDEELAAIDLAASRFRDDSELTFLNATAGDIEPRPVSRLLHEAITLALRAAELTDGAVDPTLGAELVALGYDRDLSALDTVEPSTPLGSPPRRGGAPRIIATRTRRPAWREIELSDRPPGVRLPAGVSLDLGATAKALAADRAAAAAHQAAAAHHAAAEPEDGPGVLVSLGGDIATAGPAPQGGWAIHVTDDHRAGPDAPGQTIAVHSGGLATSSLITRRWRTGAAVHHHILDPRTGADVDPVWRTVSVAAVTCADANIASTAAIVLGEAAPAWLTDHGLPARLVAVDGSVTLLNGWPDER